MYEVELEWSGSCEYVETILHGRRPHSIEPAIALRLYVEDSEASSPHEALFRALGTARSEHGAPSRDPDRTSVQPL